MQFTGNVGDYGMAGKARWARVKHAQGWSIEEIARHYGVPSSVITQVLQGRYRRPRFSRALDPVEKQRRLEAQTRLRNEARALARAQRWEPDGPDPEVPEGPPPATAAAELVGQAPTAIPAAQLEPPAVEPWEGPVSPHASPGKPRKITAEVLAQALELHAEGMSWPAIARKFGCHRMAFYHALRRPPA